MTHKNYFTSSLLALALLTQPALADESSTTPEQTQDAAQQQWIPIEDSDGIQTWKLDIPGAILPGFRGQARIAAPAETILAQIKDADNHDDWMHRCMDARLLKQVDDQESIIYNRTDSPWPVWDRDAVLSSRIERAADNSEITVRFRNVTADEMPEVEDAVRMPRLEGFYKLTALNPNETQVEYVVEVDVGGSIPAWIAEMVARELPFETLASLRKRTAQ